MPVLAIDTATALTTVAVLAADGTVLAESSHRDARRHAEALPPLVREALRACAVAPADLELVAVGVGPGPFTGLRVGVAFARATAQALGIPAVGAMSLDVIARGRAADISGPFTVVTRSRRVEVAWATYDTGSTGIVERTEGPLILPDPGYPRRGVVIGDVPDVDQDALPAAADLGRLVLERIASGEVVPRDRESPTQAAWPTRAWPEDASDGSGAPTAALLASMAAQGRWLLPALPLYLRRPDAVPA